MIAVEPTITEVRPQDLESWGRSDEWLAQIADLLEETADECSGEPAVGMWALRAGDLTVGCVGVLRRRKTGRLELCRLHVRPEFRGRGLSKRLIAHALAHAHAHAAEAVTAQCREDNPRALAALAAFGFAEVSRTARAEDGKTILLLEEGKGDVGS
ncbi:MAG: GNAT family N-acetyltransferase [Planctomycetota bacterium]|jgi:ribosomal protein S18 acetylase RimI-like enzyme